MDNEFENNDEILGKDVSQIDIEDILDNGVSDEMVSGATEEEKKENKKKLKQQILVSANLGKNVIDKNLDVIMHESMLPYSEHVILDRALPRVEDGLKPVQRRILYTMHEQGLTPDKPHKKSAKVVGDCLARYHPHGDTSVYDAMVRLAQDFNLRATLVDGQGNFGSIDGDGAAAMRYTEAKMTPLALEMLRDLEKDTVPWMLTYDDSQEEPVLLPSRFPNILVNGATGIAVGLATNIPPHNLAESINGAIAYIDNPDISLDEMMKIIKAPDFPTGGFIVGKEELRQAYETGKGKIIIRAKVHIEGGDGEKKNIVVTEIPYQVNKAKLQQKILEVRESKKDVLGGITEILDESDMSGMRIVIKIRKDADYKKILEYLFKYTDLQVSYGINMVAIADGRPQQMGLLDILAYYVNFQREVIYRRTKFDLDAAKERQHILQGLVIAVRNIDEVVKIIKTSESVTVAKQRLKERFTLSDRQAQAILDMRLARLTSLEIFKLEQELLELEKRIAELTRILSSKKAQFELVKEEMGEIKKKYKDGRRSDIIDALTDYEVKTTAGTGVKGPVENVTIVATASGAVKCMTTRHFAQVSKVWNERSGLHEVITASLTSSSDKTVLAFSNLGNAYKLDLGLLPDNKFRDKGTPLSKIMPSASSEEKVVFFMELGDNLLNENLLFFTKQGMIKKTAVNEYQLLKTAYQAMKLKDGDEIINIEFDKPNTTILFTTKEGMSLNAEKSDIPVQGRISGGVKGINMTETDEAVLITQISPEDSVVLISNTAYAKRVNVNEIDVLARYRKGVKIFDLKGESSSGTKVIASALYKASSDVVIINSAGDYSNISASSIEEDTRASRGRCLSIGQAQLASAYIRTL
ncbi:MAG: DNA topoisomerase 4 subunit A [Clostridia bacterium]|nr:DNA topoisomerase 4 subunit A [Clostridia bacterium]